MLGGGHLPTAGPHSLPQGQGAGSVLSLFSAQDQGQGCSHLWKARLLPFLPQPHFHRAVVSADPPCVFPLYWGPAPHPPSCCRAMCVCGGAFLPPVSWVSAHPQSLCSSPQGLQRSWWPGLGRQLGGSGFLSGSRGKAVDSVAEISEIWP